MAEDRSRTVEDGSMAENMYNLCIKHSHVLSIVKKECARGKIKYKYINELCVLRELIVENALSLARYCGNLETRFKSLKSSDTEN